MDTIGRFRLGNLLVLVFFVTVFLSFILFLFYLRCVIRNYILKKNLSSTSSSSLSGSELLERPQNSIKKYAADPEYETETTILMIPQHDLRISQFHCENEEEDEILRQLCKKHGGGNRKGNFFRLPKDRQDSYLKFNSVDDDLDELTDYLQMQTRNTLPFVNLRRNGQNLYRKVTWDKKSLVLIMKRNGERKYKVDDQKEPVIQTNSHRLCVPNKVGKINKEILI